MSTAPNPIATHHLPFFVTPPGQTDVLYNISMIFVVAMIVLFGVIFLTIHSLPERLAHKTKKIQLDIVAVLCLLALGTNDCYRDVYAESAVSLEEAVDVARSIGDQAAHRRIARGVIARATSRVMGRTVKVLVRITRFIRTITDRGKWAREIF